MYKKFFSFILFFLYVGLCFSHEAVNLGEIVITPYKMAISTLLNPSSTDIISVDESNAKGIFTLTGAIKNISSLNYATTGGLGGVTGVNIRGAESHHTQVLIDGIKLYDPIVTSAYFYGYNYMSLDNLEKVEISKGPYSSLYGSDSIGGTINMVTRKGEGKPSFSYTQEFGSYQTAREKFSSQGEVDRLAYSFSVSRTDVNAFYEGKYKDGNHEQDPYQNLNSSLRLDYAVSENVEVGLLSNYAFVKYEYDGWGGSDDDDNYAYFYQGMGGLNLNHKISDVFSHKTTFGYTRTYRKNWESATTNAWYDGKTYQMKWQGDYQLFELDTVIFGFDYLREMGESVYADAFFPSTSPKETSDTRGYYIENILTPLDNLFFACSYRLEDHSKYNHHNTFSVSGSYLIEETDTKIKGSIGEGFKAPSLYQLFDGIYGNPDLNPEKSQSYEAGVEQELWGFLTFGSTYFHTRIKNTIEWTIAGYVNSGKARIYGIENFVEYLINDNTGVTVSYTHMDTKKIADGTRLLRRPNNKVTCELKTSVNKLDIYTDLSYVGNRIDGFNKLKSYILGSLALNYAVNEKIETFVRFENIFDRDYELVEGYQTPKFSGYVGAKIKF